MTALPTGIWWDWDYVVILDWDDATFEPDPTLPDPPPVEGVLPAELRARIHRFGEEMERHYGDAFSEDHVPPSPATARRLTGEYRAIGEALGREGFTVRLGTTWWL